MILEKVCRSYFHSNSTREEQKTPPLLSDIDHDLLIDTVTKCIDKHSNLQIVNSSLGLNYATVNMAGDTLSSSDEDYNNFQDETGTLNRGTLKNERNENGHSSSHMVS